MQFGVSFGRGRTEISSFKVALGFIAFAALATNPVQAETALQAGEQLTYSVRWAVLPAAGQIQISAGLRHNEGPPQLSIVTTTETRGLAKSLMTFQAHSESIFDLRTGRMVALHESSVARAKR